MSPNTSFDLEPYLQKVKKEISLYGYDVEIQDRSTVNNTVKKAFLEDNSIGFALDTEIGDMLSVNGGSLVVVKLVAKCEGVRG